jgi:hypothetical protein
MKLIKHSVLLCYVSDFCFILKVVYVNDDVDYIFNKALKEIRTLIKINN